MSSEPQAQKRTAIYLRVSSEDQVEKYGLPIQRERCRAQTTAKGWQVVAEFEDAGISGTKGANQRPGLAALLQAAHKGEIDSVIVLALDRLARKALLVLSLIDELTQCGVDIVSCKESLDTSTPHGKFVVTILAGVSELERDVIVQRTSAGRDERGKKDGERGGRVPFGYQRWEDGLITVDKEAAEVVQRIFKERANNKTLTAIAEGLNASGISPARKGQDRYNSAKWYASTVQSVLRNEQVYRGGKRGSSEVRWQAIL